MSIENVKVNNVAIPNGGAINLNTSTSAYATFSVTLTKLPSYTIGDCKLYIHSKSSVSGNIHEYFVANIFTSGFTESTTLHYGFDFLATDFNFNGGFLYAELVQNNSPGTKWTSNSIPVVKSPTYTITQDQTSNQCGSKTPVTFTVSSNAPNNTYQWSFGSSWLLNSSSTTSNTITLTPNTYPLGYINVTPTYNGGVQPYQIASVSLAPFTSTASITGSNCLCSNATYSITGLEAGQTVAWSLSDTNIASLSSTTGAQTTLTRVSHNGQLTIKAIITNPCGQTSDVTPKTVWVGAPSIPTKLTGPTTVSTGALVTYSATSQGASSYEWWLPYPYETVDTFDYFGQNWQKLTNASSSSSIRVFTGFAGNSGLIQVMGENECGFGGAKSLSVSHGASGGPIPRMANPTKNTKYKIYPNPSNDVVNIELSDQKIKGSTNSKIIAELFDLSGNQKKKVEIINNIATISVQGLIKGIYILKINIDGQIESHQVSVQ